MLQRREAEHAEACAKLRADAQRYDGDARGDDDDDGSAAVASGLADALDRSRAEILALQAQVDHLEDALAEATRGAGYGEAATRGDPGEGLAAAAAAAGENLARRVHVLEDALAHAAEETHALERQVLTNAPDAARTALRDIGLALLARRVARWAGDKMARAFRAWLVAAAAAPSGTGTLDVDALHQKVQQIQVKDGKSALAQLLHATELLHHHVQPALL